MTKVKIFSTKTCPYCYALKNYLKQKGISYEEVLLDENPEEIRTAIDTCGQMGVPCTHIETDDGKQLAILGFDQPRIDEALGL